MLKWLGRFLFIIIATSLSLQVYNYARYSTLQKYYFEYMMENIDNDDKYLKGLNTLADLEYHKKDPIYEYISNNEDYKFKLALRTVAADIYNDKNELIKVDGIMIFLNNVQIKDTETPILKITVTLDQNSIYSSDDKIYTNELAITYNPHLNFPQSNLPVSFLLNAKNSLLINDTTSNITSIKVEYAKTYHKDQKIQFEDIPLFIASRDEISEAALLKDSSLSIEHEDFLLLEGFENNMPNEEQLQQYNLINAKDSLKQYNKIVWLTMGGYVLIVVLLAYFLFFNKKFMQSIKDKFKKNPIET